MIARGPDRRWRARSPEQLLPERRDGLDRRAMRSQPVPPSAIRIGYGETPPRAERRRFPESGME
ncbi:hypothetical protein [Massilia sp. Leaf139]|uniref:hypothetical protein n=1 Tax=Massilia sp. Leaf139 TaxID=1736272 RepID=UPI000B2AC21E|nr:hypothetical protein [Massilia sp. Leaf139]